MSPLLHLVVATLRETVDPQIFERSVEHGRALAGAPGVRGQVMGWSPEHFVSGTLLGSAADLDRFVASEEHMRFVMHGLAPVIGAMWSTAIETDVAALRKDASHLWVFGLPAQAGVYEWQVREFLDEVARLASSAIVGVTVEERERFRAGGLVVFNNVTEMEAAVARARSRWLKLGGAMEDAVVRAGIPEPK